MELPDGVIVESRLTENDPDRLRIGMPMEVVEHRFAAPHADDGEVRTFAFRPAEEGGPTVTDVAIIGIGLHRFGRHPGVSALEMGAFAVRKALRDAGVEWRDIPFAVGGSLGGVLKGGSSPAPDSLVAELGLTGLTFTNVANGCATAGAAVDVCASSIRSGQYDIGLAVGFDKHPRGHFDVESEYFGLPDWYAETGFMLSTQYFALKTKRWSVRRRPIESTAPMTSW